MQWTTSTDQGHTRVAFSGDLSESAEAALAKLKTELKTKHIIFDFLKLERVNSPGVAAWTKFALALKGAATFEYENCPPVFVDYANMTASFLAGGKIVSFMVPYLCGCRTSAQVPMRTADASPDQEFAPVSCKKCGKSMTAEVGAEDFLRFKLR